MCFSATASFGAAAVIGAVGAVTLWTAARRRQPALVPIAAFPMLFAAQQLIEGLLWVDLARPAAGACRPFLVHAFLGYAEVFWPVFAPLAALAIEPVRWRRHLIMGCVVIGIALAAYLLVMMIAHPYAASVTTGNVVYDNGATYLRGIELPYVLATTVSLLLSSHHLVRLMGGVILGGFAGAYWSYHHAYISVWCFFAALASALAYLFVRAAPPREALTGTANPRGAAT